MISNEKDMIKAVHSELRNWQRTSELAEETFSGTRLLQQEYASLVDIKVVNYRLAIISILQKGLTELSLQRASESQLLRLRFAEAKSLEHIANHLSLSVPTVSRKQRHAINNLGSLLWRFEHSLRRKKVSQLKLKLPAPGYSELLGSLEVRGKLTKLLIDPDGPGIVAITGIGGIGKTALAHAVTEASIDSMIFEDIVWISIDPLTNFGDTVAKQIDARIAYLFNPSLADENITPYQLRRFVRKTLSEQKVLVIVDNIESPADYASIISQLREWSGLSRFLVTSRAGSLGIYDVYVHSVSELNEEDSYKLLISHANQIGLHAFATISSEKLKEIYDIVGGSPLALKLVASLAAIVPLNQILINLQRNYSNEVSILYRTIYWNIWQALTEEGKTLLMVMLLVSHTGGTTEYLQSISGLPNDKFWSAVSELVQRCMLEVIGNPWERRYSIHRLTCSFLQNEIVQRTDRLS